jgi:hypothetical protein
MLVTDSARVSDHIALLTRRGITGMATELNRAALDRNWIPPATFHQLQAVIATTPQTCAPKVFGVFNQSVITDLHFAPQTDHAVAREAFRQGVHWIEIETSSQCNRRCSYCPNSLFDRITSNGFMDMGVYEKMITDLTEIDYDGEIKFVGNNEFFMHKQNRAYVEMAHSKLPKARLSLFSNGDYITRDDLEWAARHGVTMLYITLHPGPTKSYDDLEVLRRCYLFQQQTATPLQLVRYLPGKQLQFAQRIGGLTVIAGSMNLTELGHNWTSLLPGHEEHVRTDPCTYPIRQFVVNYLGDIFMCCIAFKDRTPENESAGAITGNLQDYPSVFHAYASPGMAAWRRGLFNNQEKTGPCKTCTGHGDYVEAAARPLADYVGQHA